MHLIIYHFSGGAELLFGNIKKRELTLDADKSCKKYF